MVGVVSCLKDWEIADAHLQHNVEKETKELELAFDNMYLDEDATTARMSHPFSEENRMHLICVPGSEFHTCDRLMSVISQNNAQNIQKRFINFYYTHEGRHEGLYTNNDNYEDVTPSSSSTGFRLIDRILRTPRS
jgi:GTP cyclohydrolase II